MFGFRGVLPVSDAIAPSSAWVQWSYGAPKGASTRASVLLGFRRQASVPGRRRRRDQASVPLFGKRSSGSKEEDVIGPVACKRNAIGWRCERKEDLCRNVFQEDHSRWVCALHARSRCRFSACFPVATTRHIAARKALLLQLNLSRVRHGVPLLKAEACSVFPRECVPTLRRNARRSKIAGRKVAKGATCFPPTTTCAYRSLSGENAHWAEWYDEEGSKERVLSDCQRGSNRVCEITYSNCTNPDLMDEPA